MKKTYVIGDVHGNILTLKSLLDHINYDSTVDNLIFLGDLVGADNDNVGTLRFIRSLPNTISLLGNHDINVIENWYLLNYSHLDTRKPKLFLDYVSQLDASDISWMQSFQLVLKIDNYIMVHAGIPTLFLNNIEHDLDRVCNAADKLSTMLKQDISLCVDIWYYPRSFEFNEKHLDLSNRESALILMKIFTQVRYVKHQNFFEEKKSYETSFPSEGIYPWYNNLHLNNYKILFGHWSELRGKSGREDVINLDTGCKQKDRLTCYRLEDGITFSVKCIDL